MDYLQAPGTVLKISMHGAPISGSVEGPELDGLENEAALGVPAQHLEARHHVHLVAVATHAAAQPAHLHLPPPVLSRRRRRRHHDGPRAAPKLARLGGVGAEADGAARHLAAAHGQRRLLVREAQAAALLRRAVHQVRRVGRRRREQSGGGRQTRVNVQGRAVHQLRHLLPEPARRSPTHTCQISFP
jgi:hypothetical protein